MLGLDAGVSVVIEMHGRHDHGEIRLSTAAVIYSAATVQRLARLDLSVDHDQYVVIDGLPGPTTTAPAYQPG
jgi:phosphatidylserine synthase